MILLAITLILLVLAYRSSRAILKNKLIFREFNETIILALLVCLYPLAPFLLVVLSPIIDKTLLFSMLLMFYIPQIFIARKQAEVFERSGTDKVEPAKKALNLAMIGAIIGVTYVLIHIIIFFAVNNLDNSVY